MKHELQDIISGKSTVRNGEIIQAISRYLKRSRRAGEIAQDSKLIKKEEAELIKNFCAANNLLISDSFINLNNFIAEGAEQKVYLCDDGLNVIKLNGSVFYTR